MNALQKANRLAQIAGRIDQLKASIGMHELRAQFIPRGTSEPALYVEGQRDIIRAHELEIERLNGESRALVAQPEFAF